MKILSNWKNYLSELPIVYQMSKIETASLWMRLIIIMRFRDNEVNFKVTYDEHQNLSNCSQNMFLSNLDSIHMLTSKLNSLCLNLCMSSSFFLNLIHSPAVSLFHI